MPRTRQQTATKIAPDSIAQLGSVFDALPEKPKETYTLREAVAQLDTPIRTALGRGYSYNEIAAMLSEHEIAISAFSLKRYLSLNKVQQPEQSAPAQQKRRRGRQPKSASEAAAEPSVAPIVQAEQPEPAPKQRGRTSKTAAKAKPAARTTNRTAKGRERK
jgi:hypothetical protein